MLLHSSILYTWIFRLSYLDVLLFASEGKFDVARVFDSGSGSSTALTSRKWYRMIRSMAAEPRKTANRYNSLSEIMLPPSNKVADKPFDYCLNPRGQCHVVVVIQNAMSNVTGN